MTYTVSYESPNGEQFEQETATEEMADYVAELVRSGGAGNVTISEE